MQTNALGPLGQVSRLTLGGGGWDWYSVQLNNHSRHHTGFHDPRLLLPNRSTCTFIKHRHNLLDPARRV